MRASIVGAGIGGLTTAIALRRAGIETTVFERAGKLREVGAGLLLAANAVRALDGLGLSEKVRQIGTPASAARILSWHGETLEAGRLEARAVDPYRLEDPELESLVRVLRGPGAAGGRLPSEAESRRLPHGGCQA
ncbi:MAG TPA: FAD-dependent monooxygenase [Rubrobacter sp.]|jgi:2-polyprenyl-6-methoxyphenol hydroxylase-like FAD-dependent oxidoreductase|nr:FAD-dependent monooxygenase [Rubrobacter sp.]